MLKVKKQSPTVRVETGAAIFEWDLNRGAQLTRADVKGHGVSHSLFVAEVPAPNLRLETSNGVVAVADSAVDVTFGREDEECFVFEAKSRLGDLFNVEQKFEVFREGVVFCEFNIVLDEGKAVELRAASMSFPFDVLSTKRVRVGYMSRDPYPKQDVTCIHVLAQHKLNMERTETIDAPHLLPCVGLNLGWDEARYYSNRVEAVIEDSTSIGGGMLNPTRTLAGPKDGCWEVRWSLCEKPEKLQAPFFYRNRWALALGAAKTEAGPKAEPARRNNVMAARICHVMYPYVREGNEWPWTSVPVRQTFYQDVQLAVANPELERVDEAADLGANVLILHQFWMTNGGSNGEPMADYRAYDPQWLAAFVGRAHERGMRVGFYMRGIERYCLYCDFFERFLKKDWDGLYIDWSTPFALGFCKTTALHCSAYDWFMYVRALRHRVGEGGFLIGHTAIPTFMAVGAFDALIAGEFSVMHGGLLVSPEYSASYSLLSGCGVNLISGDSPDRSVFSSGTAAAFCAGLGYSSHPFMQPNQPFREANAFIQPLWDLWAALGSAPVRVFNPAVGTRPVTTADADAIHTVVYQAADGTALALAANLSDGEVKGNVDIDLEALGLAGAPIEPVEADGTYAPAVTDSRLVLKGIPAYGFGGVVIRRTP